MSSQDETAAENARIARHDLRELAKTLNLLSAVAGKAAVSLQLVAGEQDNE